MIVAWRNGPDLHADALGNPASSDWPSCMLCLYDNMDALIAVYMLLSAGGFCGWKYCWKTLGEKPFHRGCVFQDPAARVDSINRISLKGRGGSLIKSRARTTPHGASTVCQPGSPRG